MDIFVVIAAKHYMCFNQNRRRECKFLDYLVLESFEVPHLTISFCIKNKVEYFPALEC